MGNKDTTRGKNPQGQPPKPQSPPMEKLKKGANPSSSPVPPKKK